MKSHRLRSMASTDEKLEAHFFVELEQDSWVELKQPVRVTHKAIHEYLEREENEGIFHLRMSTRYFSLYGMKLTDLEPITD